MKMKILCWLSLLGGGAVAMAASEPSTTQRKLDQTPTWAVASVCAVMILISLFLEKGLHKLGHWLTEKRKNALFEALDKVKSELMVLGFISLLLTFGQNYITKICIPEKAIDTMLPCRLEGDTGSTPAKAEEHRRRLLWADRRFLAGAETVTNCKKGHEPLISADGLHQLHILIFFLAVFHVVYSLTTMMLGRLKIRGWKKWELETQSHNYEFSNDPTRFRLTHETSFVRAHNSFWTKIPVFFYIGCFFRQFFRSVGKADYLTLRNGFISVHLAPGSKFDFQKYIKRSLEDDFKVVVGVSPALWVSFIIFLLVNVNGWEALFWASLIPVILILAVGTELQSVLTQMALEIVERHAVIQGMPLVQGSDKYFWFGRPHLVLHLIHFTLFVNAFQITYFFWIWYSFGLRSCFHADFKFVIVKIALGVGVLLLCSYITLPLYALVTQMGSNMKKSIFDEQTSKALKKWHKAVKKRHAKGGKSPTITLGGNASPASTVHSSVPHKLHRYKTTGHSTRSFAYDDQEISDMEAEPLAAAPSSTEFMVRVGQDDQATEISEPNHHHDDETSNEDFSFAKPAPAKEN